MSKPTHSSPSMNHGRHPDCLETLPIDSCHWVGCDKGVPAEDRVCNHNEGTQRSNPWLNTENR